ncbi:hypothetical protein ALP03_00044 [Pseudomonas amygdali pv. tabaci]|uniref:DUF4427 domain-containing protein n=1 Tax=Pseudomonas amygdali pv. tabaci TaxID=322 RepID=A0A3M6HY89_PSEAJ|nr:hypothetical protein ALP03_00044 [Pseudomonas amygdali pv. tabaci]
MRKRSALQMAPRMAHFFRDIDLTGKSCPELVPDSFPLSCRNDDEQCTGGILLRLAVRHDHLWATYGIRDGQRTIRSTQPAVCFSRLDLGELIALRDGLCTESAGASLFALTLPISSALRGGISLVTGEAGLPEDQGGGNISDPQGRKSANDEPFQRGDRAEWRWHYSGNYLKCMQRIELEGLEGNPIPGLRLSEKKWAGIGVVVPDLATARNVQYDILTLIDKGVVSATHFDHILVCDQLPESLDGLDEDGVQAAFARACFDFKSCMEIPALEASLAELDFSSRLQVLEWSTPQKPVHESGGCWLWFEDSRHRYVRSLVAIGRVKVNSLGRYLAPLVELSPYRDLRQRQEMAEEVARDLQKRFGVRSSYFSVLGSMCPDDAPSFSGKC